MLLTMLSAENYSNLAYNLPKQITETSASTVPFFSFAPAPAYSTLQNEESDSFQFEPWGKENELSLTRVENNSDPPVLRLQGSTGNESVGFYTRDIDYEGNNISLTIGGGKSWPEGSRITISFLVQGDNKEYQLIFVNGAPLHNGSKELAGKVGDAYHKSLSSNSSISTNLQRFGALYEDNYSYLDGMAVGVTNNTRVDPIEIKVTLGDATESNNS